MQRLSKATEQELSSWDNTIQNCTDLFYFGYVILSEAWQDKFRDSGTMHKAICKFLMSDSRKKFLSAFRGSLKTTWLMAFIIYLFCWHLQRKMTTSIVYNTATKENAWNLQADIKHTLLENPHLHWIFKSLPKSENAYHVMTKNRIEHGHVRIDFTSLDTTLVSRHYPIWLNDDLENDDNINTEYQRDELRRKWRYQKAVLTKVKKTGLGLEVDTGTPFHFQGLIWHIKHLETYDKLEIPCWVTQGGKKVVTFPELYTVEDFEEKRKEMGKRIFTAQYELIPLSEEDVLCPEKWIKYWTILPERVWRTMVIDPGGADPKRSDPTGITICDTDETGTIHVVYAEELWLTPMKLLETIIKLKEDYNPDDVRIEKERYSITIADQMRHKYASMNIGFVEHKGRSKHRMSPEGRIWRLRSWFERKRIVIGRNQHALFEQLTQYPGTKHDDVIDSLAYHLDIVRIPPKHIKHYLPSGKEFKPNIQQEFEEEMDKYFKFKKEGERSINDSIY